MWPRDPRPLRRGGGAGHQLVLASTQLISVGPGLAGEVLRAASEQITNKSTFWKGFPLLAEPQVLNCVYLLGEVVGTAA